MAELEPTIHESQPRHIDPEELDYLQYFDHLLSFNKVLQKRVSSDLEQELGDIGDKVCVVTTGSDGRLEKGPVSPVELVMYAHTPKGDSAQQLMAFEDGSPGPVTLADRLCKYIENHEHFRLFADEVEIKDVDNDAMSYLVISPGTENEVSLISPNRVFDAKYLFGEKAVLRDAQQKMVAELNGEKGKSIYKNLKDRMKSHSKVTATGVQRFKGEDNVQYDLETGITTYDPEQGIWSFKQGPLRLVQYALVRDFTRELRADADPHTVFGHDTNTVVKLNDLAVSDQTPLSTGEMRDLADCYKFFLWGYHKSQQQYSQNGNTYIGFDPAELKERTQALTELCSGPLVRL